MDESVLKTTVERTGPTEQLVKGEVQWSEVKAKLDETFKELSREVSLKGFRRGKVPRSLMEKMFGKRVRAEVSSQLLREAVAESVKTHSMRVITPPAEWDIESDGIVKESPIEFQVKLEVLPVIEPKDYFGVEVEKNQVEATDDEIEAFIEREQKNLTQLEPIEDRSVIQRGDVVECEIMGKIGNDPLSMASTKLKIPTEEELKKNEVDEPLPGLGEALVGKDTAEEDVDIELSYDDDAPENYKGKTAKILVTFKGLKKEIIPKLDDDFAKDTGVAETFDEYKEKVREVIQNNHDEREKEALKNRVMEAVCAKNEIELSPRIIDMEVDRMRRQFASMGIRPEDIQKAGGRFEESLRDRAKQEMHQALIIDAISEKEGVEVSEEDLEDHLEKLAEYRNTNVARLKADLQNEGALESVKMRLREEKTIDLLLSRAHAKSKKEEVAKDAEDDKEGTSDDDKIADKGEPESKETQKKSTTKKKTAKKATTKKTTKKTTNKKAAAKKPAADKKPAAKKTTKKKTTKKKTTAKKSTEKETEK